MNSQRSWLVTSRDFQHKYPTLCSCLSVLQTQNMLELKTRLEELQMENEYQLRLKDMDYDETLKELSDKFTQEIESLKTMQQAMKTEMEKQEREHQQSSAEAAVKHLVELKDLELSSSQKLIVEHKSYQDLQHEHQRMQGDFEMQLRAAEESNVQSLEELTQLYEAQLQEKTRLLVQCEEDAQQQVREFKEFTRQVKVDEERMIHDIQVKYEKKLHTERETNANLKGESSVGFQKANSLQRQVEDRCADINQLKQERLRLLGLIRSLENDVDLVKRQISGLESTNNDKDETIGSLKKKNQELEKLKFILDFQLSELNNKTETQQDDVNEKKQQINQLKEELGQIDKSNTQLKLSISNLGLKLRTKDKEMHKEMLMVSTRLTPGVCCSRCTLLVW
ncbi:Cilia- and flagella-associated protein 57 [Liparis tanakae]|uniref:Cilia-and flagella-associated protein 57 n=1 Tax=Liparis tanakae TaxID=230148 RepID=A0A4Z2IQW6_9TELE|nr:Cilia- and flagella-associated protein 57 [Liparis tanakae]